MSLVLLLQLLACAAMTGIIWIVQLAIYPLFRELPNEAFEKYHGSYMSKVTFVIVPLMALEALTCVWCLFNFPLSSQIIPTLLLGVIWASTAFIQVPQHNKLTRENAHLLVRSNWIRTIAWTARTVLLATLLC